MIVPSIVFAQNMYNLFKVSLLVSLFVCFEPTMRLPIGPILPEQNDIFREVNTKIVLFFSY